MTKAGAIYNFLSWFEIPVYAETSVPSDAEFPYMTYQLATGAFDDGEINIPVSLWYYTDSESIPNAKAEEIASRLGRGGCMVPCDNGGIWLKQGSPFCQSVQGEGDNEKVKMRLINIDCEFFTEY